MPDETVLVVVEDRVLGEDLRRLFEAAGYPALACESALDVFRVFESETVAALVLDPAVSVRDGIDLKSMACALGLDLVVVSFAPGSGPEPRGGGNSGAAEGCRLDSAGLRGVVASVQAALRARSASPAARPRRDSLEARRSRHGAEKQEDGDEEAHCRFVQHLALVRDFIRSASTAS